MLVLGVEVSWKVLLPQRSSRCRCSRCGEHKYCRPLFGHLPTLNVGQMWVHLTCDLHRPACLNYVYVMDLAELRG